jgi:hypothetical protein
LLDLRKEKEDTCLWGLQTMKIWKKRGPHKRYEDRWIIRMTLFPWVINWQKNGWKKGRKGRENAIRKGVERIMPFVRNNSLKQQWTSR